MRKERTCPSLPGAIVLLAASFPALRAEDRPASPVAQPRGALPATRPRVALLVGIDRYARDAESRGPPDLSGAARDVASVRELLLSRFGFEPEDVRVLVDEQATHAAIVAAFHDSLIARSGPETEALFWFSGHGSRCADASGAAGAEAGDKDSTLLAHDSRSAAGFDLTDDELHSLLRALAAKKTSRITVVTDSCHSGGAMRGDALPVRFAEPGSRPPRREDLEPFWPADVPLLEDDDPKRREPLHYVHLAACANDESAHEHAVDLASGERVVHGAFTFFLLDSLQRMTPGTTWEQLARDVSVRLSAAYRGQQSQAEGGRGDLLRVAFEGRFAEPLPGFEARVAPKRSTLEVAAGWMQQLREGALLEVRGLDGKTMGQARTRAVRATSAIAEWVGPPPPIVAPAAVRAIELERGTEARPLRLRVASDAAGDAERAKIVDALASGKRPRVELVRDPSLAAPIELARGKEPGGFELRALPEGFAIGFFDSPEQASRLSVALAREAQFQGLLELAAARGAIPVRVSLERWVASTDGARGSLIPEGSVAAELTEPGAGGFWRVRVPDEPAAKPLLQVRVELDRARKGAAHVTILCLSEDRSVVQLYPLQEGVRDNELSPGEPLRWPIRVCETRVPGLGRAARDRILVLATQRPADFSAFLQEPALEEVPATRGPADRIPELLLDAFAPCRTRGAGAVAPAEEPFGVASLDMEVAVARGGTRKE